MYIITYLEDLSQHNFTIAFFGKDAACTLADVNSLFYDGLNLRLSNTFRFGNAGRKLFQCKGY